MAYIPGQQQNTGSYVPTTNVWEVARLYEVKQRDTARYVGPDVCPFCGRSHLTTLYETLRYEPRTGCLDCDVWFTEERTKATPGSTPTAPEDGSRAE